MKRVTRQRPLSTEEAAKYKSIRERVTEELPELIARHNERMTAHETPGPSSTSPADRRSEPDSGMPKREFSPKFWDGMVAPAWFSICWRNRFKADLKFWPVVFIICILSLIHSVLAALQAITLNLRANKTKIEKHPIFVIGHWRSGTTLLHELMVLDDRHGFPSTYACFAPAHFLSTQWFAFWFLNWLLPSNRQIDNMPAGWRLPQEDEFAICNLGECSPYATFAFPNHPPMYEEYLTLKDVPPQDRERWKNTLMRFLRHVTYRVKKQLVLKSPTHTARVKTILEMFPNARFIHIVRTPYKVIPSTINLWKTLYTLQGMQTPKFVGLEDHAFKGFRLMYESFEEDRSLIPPENFAEVRYEDLLKNPTGEMRAIYDKLSLGAFDAVEPRIVQYLSDRRDYKTNKYEEPTAILNRVTRECGEFLEKYGYEAKEGNRD